MRALDILTDLQHVWPVASRWLAALRKYAAAAQTRAGRNQPFAAVGTNVLLSDEVHVSHLEPCRCH